MLTASETKAKQTSVTSYLSRPLSFAHSGDTCTSTLASTIRPIDNSAITPTGVTSVQSIDLPGTFSTDISLMNVVHTCTCLNNPTGTSPSGPSGISSTNPTSSTLHITSPGKSTSLLSPTNTSPICPPGTSTSSSQGFLQLPLFPPVRME